MNHQERRKTLPFNFIGAGIFLFFSLLFSSSFFMFMGVSSKGLYRIIVSDNPYYLLVMGLILFVSGILLYVFNKILKRPSSELIFVYAPLLTLLLIFILSLITVKNAGLLSFSIAIVSVLWSYCFFMYLSLWRRSSGLSIIVMFILGAGLAGIYSAIGDWTLSGLILVIKISLVLYLALLMSYELGLLGFIRTRKYVAVAPVLISLLVILFPANKLTLKSKEHIKDYEYLSSYTTNSRNVEVQISQESVREHILFLENGRRTFSYPLSYEEELSLCFVVLQNNRPGNILVVGDSPLGLFSVLSKMPKVGVVHYLPTDPLYIKIWENYVSSDISNTFVVISGKEQLMNKYGMIIFFPPTVRGYGTKAGLSRSMFKLLAGKLLDSGTFTIVLSKELIKTELPVNLEGRLQNILYAIYGSVHVSDLNGFRFLMASKDPSNISADPSVIKYRYLALGVEYEYAKAKDFFDGTIIKIHDTVPQKMNSRYLQVGFIVAGIVLLLFLLYLAHVFRPSYLNSILEPSIFIYVMILGAGFALSLLINQMFKVDSFSIFTPYLALFLVSSLMSALFVAWKMINKLFFVLTMIFVLPLIFILGYYSLYPLLLGSIFGLVFAFSEVKKYSRISLLSMYLCGIGAGMCSLFVLDMYLFSLTEISIILGLTFIMVVVYNVLLSRRTT